MVPIITYIEFGEQPQDKVEVRRLQCRAMRYTVMEGVLYRKGYTLPYFTKGVWVQLIPIT